ncbi:MAG: hypothetical protein DMG39_00565 [Acidobacteria bacterium]|nr:MAG: hypothetical protein DMG39_00565 [Acidobacteriota bacterium]
MFQDVAEAPASVVCPFISLTKLESKRAEVFGDALGSRRPALHQAGSRPPVRPRVNRKGLERSAKLLRKKCLTSGRFVLYFLKREKLQK